MAGVVRVAILGVGVAVSAASGVAWMWRVWNRDNDQRTSDSTVPPPEPLDNTCPICKREIGNLPFETLPCSHRIHVKICMRILLDVFRRCPKCDGQIPDDLVNMWSTLPY